MGGDGVVVVVVCVVVCVVGVVHVRERVGMLHSAVPPRLGASARPSARSACQHMHDNTARIRHGSARM